MNTDEYSPSGPHDPIEEVFPDVFLVRGSLQMNPLMRIGRNMVVIRDGDGLTVLNSVRLAPAGEAQLDALGTVNHVMRIGYFHGRDDCYYVDRYGAEFWTPAGARTEPGPAATRTLTEDSELPMRDAEVFLWRETKHPEAAILIRREGGILITCDAVQNHTDSKYNNWLARLTMPLMGFPGRMLIGPFWKKAMTPAAGSIRSDFERLLALEFEHLIPGHGAVQRGGAKAALQQTVALDLPD